MSLNAARERNLWAWLMMACGGGHGCHIVFLPNNVPLLLCQVVKLVKPMLSLGFFAHGVHQSVAATDTDARASLLYDAF